MGESNNVRTLFRNIRIQQPVRTLEPFAIAERTARRVDPLADLIEGARFGGLIGSIAGQREARNMAKIEREEFERRRERDEQIRDIANRSVTVNADTGQPEIDPDVFKAGLMAGGHGLMALQMSKAEQAQAFQRQVELEKIRADVLGARAQMMRAQRQPQPTAASIAMQAAGGDPEKAMELMERQRRAGAVSVNVGPTGIDYGKPPEGTTWIRDQQGSVLLEPDARGRYVPQAAPIPGSKRYDEVQKQMEKGTLTKRNRAIASNIVTGNIKNIFNAMQTSEMPTTGLAGILMSYVPAIGGQSTGARTIANSLETVRANVGFDKLQQMREASQTGGAVGQVSDFENRLMQATLGYLGQGQGRNDFVRNLAMVHDVSLDIAYGPGYGPARFQSLEERYPDPGVLRELEANQTIQPTRFTQREPEPMGLPMFGQRETPEEPPAQPGTAQGLAPGMLDQMQTGDTLTLPGGATLQRVK